MQLLTDNIVEGDEDFFLRLSSTDPLLTTDPAREEATVTINDLTSMFLAFTIKHSDYRVYYCNFLILEAFMS